MNGWADLPGAELIDEGLADLARGEITHAALLVAIGAPRLRALGLPLPADLPEEPEHRLFFALAAERDDRFRRLISLGRALEPRKARGLPSSDRQSSAESAAELPSSTAARSFSQTSSGARSR